MSRSWVVQSVNNCLLLSEGIEEIKFHFLWLRDHCRCAKCYNSTTLQRILDCTELSPDVQPKEFSVRDEQLVITWEDKHESSYNIPWLQTLTLQRYVKKSLRKPILWTAAEIQDLPVAYVKYQDLMTSSQDGVFSLVKSLIDFGVAFVEEVAPSVSATEEVVCKVAHVHHTFFGGMWEFSDALDHNDSAYTTSALAAHTDNTYFTEAAGLQILHCLHHDGMGGENLLVDGFKAAELLRQEHSDVFTRLTSTLVEEEYREEGVYHAYLAPHIKLHPLTGQVEQIRYNMNDRSPIASIEHDNMLQYYKDLKTFAGYLKSPAMEWWIKLRPGTVMFFDNFRTLHGRSSYTGHRKMCGCYVGRGDFLSKARVLGLLS